jgi:hypothetical protein
MTVGARDRSPRPLAGKPSGPDGPRQRLRRPGCVNIQDLWYHAQRLTRGQTSEAFNIRP